MAQQATKAEERRLPRVKPATDIIEKEDGFYIYVDMPGSLCDPAPGLQSGKGPTAQDRHSGRLKQGSN